MAKVKYLGIAERRVIAEGDTFGGRLADPVPSTVVWDVDSAHVADVDWPDAAVELLLEQPDFEDVTDAESYRLSLAEVLWRGRTGDTSHLPLEVDADVTDPAKANSGEGVVKDAPDYAETGATVGDGGDTAAGGGGDQAGIGGGGSIAGTTGSAVGTGNGATPQQ